jgi:hypothetical protein
VRADCGVEELDGGIDYPRIVGEAIVAAIGATRIVRLELANDIGRCRHVEISTKFAGVDSPGQQARDEIAMGLNAIARRELDPRELKLRILSQEGG